MGSTQCSADHVVIDSKQRRFTLHVPLTDIASSTRVTLRQRLLTIVSILLVVSDIPRTGFIVSPRDFYGLAGAGIVMSWGPYEYHVAHMKVADPNLINATIDASCDDTPIESLDVWSYKQDTLSIAPRAVVKYLNVTSYPPCVTYQEPCHLSTLDPSTVFRMLDGLTTSIRQRLFTTDTLPVSFYTASNWVDRLHHFLFRIFTTNPDKRLHTLRHASLGRAFQHRGQLGVNEGLATSILVPFVGNSAVKWLCEHPNKPDGRRTIPIDEHIDLRIQELGRRYPTLELDLTMFASSLIEQTRDEVRSIPSASYVTDTIEITTFVRGTHCDNVTHHCRTVFIDDYRYERSSIESDEDSWKNYVRLLRGSAQLYIWLRTVGLFCGCVCAARSEPHYRDTQTVSQVILACRILLRIPGHIIVYGSWYPLLAYALAHVFDSSLVQAVGEFAWTSVGGFYDFNLIKYTMTASIQMRNIWMFALIWKLSSRLFVACTRKRNTSIDGTGVGILSFRAGWIPFTSWLTTFALLRALHFRNTDILAVTPLPRHIHADRLRDMPVYRNFVDYGVRFDLKCFLIATVIVVAVGWFSKAIAHILSGNPTAVFASEVHYVPLSAGRLWSWGMLDSVWPMTLTRHARTARHAVAPAVAQSSDPSACRCDVCSFPASSINWRPTQGCPVHEPIFDVRRRTLAIWSMVRLTNIAAMTDPIAWLRLSVVGVPVYVYRVVADDCLTSVLLVLPTPPTPLEMKTATRRRSTWMAGISNEMQFVATVSSRDVPWRVLINCG